MIVFLWIFNRKLHVFEGLFSLGHEQEWTVTQKIGRKSGKKFCKHWKARIYVLEVCMAIFILSSAAYGIVSLHRWTFCMFPLLQGMHWYVNKMLLILDVPVKKIDTRCYRMGWFNAKATAIIRFYCVVYNFVHNFWCRLILHHRLWCK